MIDLHFHVLPGIDDGPRSTDVALRMCRAAARSGTRTIVATPHVNWDHPANNAAKMHASVVAINRALQVEGIDVAVRPGAELGLTRAAELPDGELGVLGLGGGSSLLVECPNGMPRRGIESSLWALAERVPRIVLAHPERSSAFQAPGLLEDLVARGMAACITARSLTGGYGRQARSSAWTWLTAGLVHVIASDAHDLERRPPDLGDELRRAGLGEAEIEYFARTAPAAILSNAAVPAPPAVQRSRRPWGRAGARR